MLKIEAPAKINLTLEVLGKRPDGYHEIRSIIQTIDFCDYLQIAPSSEIRVKSNMSGWLAEKSLITKTVQLLKEAAKYSGGVTIEVEKHIPLMSGLGGDSSDAAAILHGLNQVWELGYSREKLLELARQLGSDVSFFLYGGTALMEGRGEVVSPLPPIPHQWIVLIIPDLPRLLGKTQRAYSLLKPSYYTDGKITEKFVQDLKSEKGRVTSQLFNTFENIFFTRGAELATYQSHIRKIGAPNIHLAGTGPALFTLLEDREKAEDLLIRLKNQGMEAYLTETRTALEPKC
jgi:4-diphosphocytidyl-2-C-methyl-D-erythritol kinase